MTRSRVNLAARILPTLLLGTLLPSVHTQSRIRGRVTGPQGPIANAMVRVETQADARLRTLYPELLPTSRAWTVETDRRGYFSLELPSNSLYRAFATDPITGTVSLVRHDLRSGAHLRLLMLRGSRVLIRKRPTTPIAYQILGRHRESQREFTIARGKIAPGDHLPLLPPGPYRIRLRTREGRAAQESIVLQPAQDLTLTPRFKEPARLQVSGVAPKALEDYRVRLPEALRFGTADEPLLPGGFALPVYDLLLRVEIGKAVWESRELGRIEAGNSYLTKPPLGPGRELWFETGPLGKGAHVLLLWRAGARIAKRLAVPGPDGNFPRLGKLPARDILLLFHDGRGHRSVQTAPGSQSTKIRLKAEPGNQVQITIRGEVPRDEFHPKITLLPRSLGTHPTYTPLYPPGLHYPGPRGRITIPFLPAGEWDLLIEANRHISKMLPITTDGRAITQEHEVTLELGYRLHGRVLGPGAKPMAGVLVKLSHPFAKKGIVPLESQTDSEGRFIFDGLPDARFILEAQAQILGHTWTARRPQIAPGAEKRDLQLIDEDPVPPDKRR